jgi:hypothetical protein
MSVNIDIKKKIKVQIDMYGNVIKTEESGMGGGGVHSVEKADGEVKETPQE